MCHSQPLFLILTVALANGVFAWALGIDGWALAIEVVFVGLLAGWFADDATASIRARLKK